MTKERKTWLHVSNRSKICKLDSVRVSQERITLLWYKWVSIIQYDTMRNQMKKEIMPGRVKLLHPSIDGIWSQIFGFIDWFDFFLWSTSSIWVEIGKGIHEVRSGTWNYLTSLILLQLVFNSCNRLTFSGEGKSIWIEETRFILIKSTCDSETKEIYHVFSCF